MQLIGVEHVKPDHEILQVAPGVVRPSILKPFQGDRIRRANERLGRDPDDMDHRRKRFSRFNTRDRDVCNNQTASPPPGRRDLLGLWKEEAHRQAGGRHQGPPFIRWDLPVVRNKVKGLKRGRDSEEKLPEIHKGRHTAVESETSDQEDTKKESKFERRGETHERIGKCSNRDRQGKNFYGYPDNQRSKRSPEVKSSSSRRRDQDDGKDWGRHRQDSPSAREESSVGRRSDRGHGRYRGGHGNPRGSKGYRGGYRGSRGRRDARQ